MKEILPARASTDPELEAPDSRWLDPLVERSEGSLGRLEIEAQPGRVRSPLVFAPDLKERGDGAAGALDGFDARRVRLQNGMGRLGARLPDGPSVSTSAVLREVALSSAAEATSRKA